MVSRYEAFDKKRGPKQRPISSWRSDKKFRFLFRFDRFEMERFFFLCRERRFDTIFCPVHGPIEGTLFRFLYFSNLILVAEKC